MTREEKVTQLCQPVVHSMGYEWVGVEFHGNSKNSILRIYVDKPQGGISMEDVVAVTEQINPLLDVEDPVNVPYTLEVSSPGLDRPLFTLDHFEQFMGHLAKINTRQALKRRRKFTGEIVSVDRQKQTVSIELTEDKDTVTIALDNIDKARLVPVFDD